MTEKNLKTIDSVTPEKLFLETPLYEKYIVTNADKETILDIKYFGGTVDCYCVHCKSDSIYQSLSYSDEDYHVDLSSISIKDQTFTVPLRCIRNINHRYFFAFRIEQSCIQKIGQFPSIADISNKDVKKYRALLGDELYGALSRAIGLEAHGVGAGSFVYLRRIFEHLIEEAHAIAAKDNGWDEEQYKQSRMGEKISLLNHHLPTFLVEHAQLYSILSKGIHTLTENECLDAFPVVRVGIELILDEKLEAKNRQRKLETASKAINKLSSEMSNQ